MAPNGPDRVTTLAVRTGGGEPVAEHVLTRDVVSLGRVMDNDVALPDAEKRVSSRHARLEKGAGGWSLVDLGSGTGTFLNGRRLEHQAPAPLKSGDEFEIGPFRLRFSVRDVADPALSPLAAALRRLDPAAIEAEAGGGAKAWARYRELYRQVLSENGG